MAHRTKLYQQARSPLIQGRSRVHRPLWQFVVSGALASFALWIGMLAADVSARLDLLIRDESFELIDLVPAPALSLLIGALFGAYLGAGLARQMGWHRGFKSAFAVALVVDLAVYFIVL
ncbi:MAG: hypothetical protein JXE06_00840 [Coriobacteriia bacterium]|nr:hypothetical protein [Coriobacteriia bacterium]MBN2822688.1 hypothetical protein [Coriobacteriia bacterium]